MKLGDFLIRPIDNRKSRNRAYEALRLFRYSDDREINNLVGIVNILLEHGDYRFLDFRDNRPDENIRRQLSNLGLRQKDLTPIFGTESRISEILSGRRPLSIKMIANLHKYLDIPYQELIDANKYDLEGDRKAQIVSMLERKTAIRR